MERALSCGAVVIYSNGGFIGELIEAGVKLIGSGFSMIGTSLGNLVGIGGGSKKKEEKKNDKTPPGTQNVANTAEVVGNQNNTQAVASATTPAASTAEVRANKKKPVANTKAAENTTINHKYNNQS